jgi:hypothetical protein
MTDKLQIIYVARVFFLEFMRNRSEQEVQFGPDYFINTPIGQKRHSDAKETIINKVRSRKDE